MLSKISVTICRVKARVYSVDLDRAIGQRTRPVVVPEGDVELCVAHGFVFLSDRIVQRLFSLFSDENIKYLR